MKSLFEGMDDTAGLLSGIGSFASILGPFFPLFSQLKSVLPPPQGWGSIESSVFAVFVCGFVKAFLHSYGHERRIESNVIQACGFFWILLLVYHYPSPDMPTTYAHDPFPLIVYIALFALPTFAFSEMQLNSARRKR